MLTPTFSLFSWCTSAIVTATIYHYNPATYKPVKASFLLFWYRIQYDGCYTSFLAAPLREMEADLSKPSLLFRRVGHCQLFSVQCAWSCTPASLLLPSSSSWILAAIIILRLTHHIKSLLQSPFSCLSDTSDLLLSQLTCISTTVSDVILIHHIFHLAFLLLLQPSTCVSHAVLICIRIHNPKYIPLPYLLYYIYAVSLMLLYP